MRITLDLPNWATDRTLRIFAGLEFVAGKLPTDTKWKVKTARCNRCGACCKNLDEGRGNDIFPLKNDGACSYLVKDGPGEIYSCSLAGSGNMPFACQLDPPNNPKCCITYEEQ
jgi:hypothetical protein